MRYLALLLVVSAASVDAQTLHKCRNTDGTSSYQQTPCDANAAAVETRQVPQVADSGPAYVAPPPRPQANPRPRVGQNRPGQQSPDTTTDRSQLYGYSCNTRSTSWVQFEPCPEESYAMGTELYFDRATQTTVPRHTLVPVPVTERKLTKRERCSGPVISGASANETYERNKRC